MKMIFVIIIVSLTLFTSCKKDNPVGLVDSNSLIGSWINPVDNDSLLSYDKSSSLKEDDYGFTFLSDGKFIERKNIGWCGTPPIAYRDFDGTWVLNDSLIEITVGYWGGKVDYKWKIVSLTSNKLSIIIVDAKYHPE